MSKNQQQQGDLARSGRGFQNPVPSGLTAAYFTEQELNELRRVCRDADSELGRRYLEAGVSRATERRG